MALALETQQVSLKIVDEAAVVGTADGDEVSGKQIYRSMGNNKVWRNDARGKYVSLMFDGQEIKFRPGEIKTFSISVANALIRASAIIVGDKLTGEIAPFLQRVGYSDLATNESKPFASPTTCPVCGNDQHTLARLTRHILKHKKTHPELFEDAQDAQEELQRNLSTEEIVESELAEADGADSVQNVVEPETDEQ